MRSASFLTAVFAVSGGLLLADVAQAQSNARLSWPGRPEAAPASTAEIAAVTGSRRPNPVIPHGGAAPEPAARSLTPAPGPARRTLTPANAWLRPAAAEPVPQPSPASAPAPAPAPTPVAAPPAPAAAPAPRPVPEYLPDQGGRGQPAPAELVYPTAASTADAGPVDPMAPRRDAPIFRLQSDAPPAPAAVTTASPPPPPPAAAPEPRPQPRVMQVVASGEPAPRAEGGRYYSVHRQNGREPDPVALPEPTYVDSLVVSGVETLASQDLAVPQEGPPLIRDRNGALRPAVAPSDGDHQ